MFSEKNPLATMMATMITPLSANARMFSRDGPIELLVEEVRDEHEVHEVVQRVGEPEHRKQPGANRKVAEDQHRTIANRLGHDVRLRRPVCKNTYAIGHATTWMNVPATV